MKLPHLFLVLALAVAAWAADTPPVPPPLIYVPYDKVPSADPKGSGVMLPYEEFRRLWEAAQRPADPLRPQMGAALTAFELTGAVEGERAVLRLSGTAVAFEAGWSSVELPAGLMVSNLRGEDDRLVLQRDGGNLVLHLPAPGTWRFSAEVAAPVARDASGGRSLNLVLPNAGSGRLDLLLPEAGAELTVQPALAVESKPEAAGGTRVRAVVGGQEAVVLSWRAPVAAAAGEALVLCDSRVDVRIGERAITTDLKLALTVLRRPIADLALRLPAGTQVLAVESPGLRTWELVGDELRLHGHEPREGAIPVHLRLERLLPAAGGATRPLELALPVVLGSERQIGVLTLICDEGLAVAVGTHEGLSQVDPREAGVEGATAAFRFLSPPPALALTVQRLEADLRVQLHQLVRLAVDETRIDVVAELAVRRAGVFTLVAPVPHGWELVDASGLAIDDTRITGEANARRLELALRARLLGDGRLVLRFRAPPALPRQGTVPALDVGLLTIDGARQARGSLAIAAPKSWALTAASAESLAGADARAVAGDALLADALRGLRDDEEVALAWSWLGQAHGPVLAAAPRSRELIAHHEELVTVAEGGLHRTITWRGEVRYSAAPLLRLRLPTALAASAQVKAAGLSERVVAAAADGQSTIELRFQTPLLGAFAITAELSEAMPRLEAGKPVTLTLAPVTLDDTTRRSALIAVARDGSLTIAASADGLDRIAAADLPPTLQAPGTVAAFRGNATAALKLTTERHDLVALTDAAIPRVIYRAVLGEDRRLRVAATVNVSSRGRPHLELRLPEGADLLEVAVDGRTTRPSRRSDGALVVPLGERAAASGDHLVAFAYEQPLGEGGLGDSAALAIALPTVGSAAEGRTIPVEQTALALWLPERLAAVAAGGDLRKQPAYSLALPEARSDGLTVAIPQVGQRLDLARLGDGGTVQLRLLSWRSLSIIGGVAGLLVAVLGWLLRRRPRAANALIAAALAVAVLAGASSEAWLPLAGGCVSGAVVAALCAGVSAIRRWRASRSVAAPPAPPAPPSDPWQVEKP